MTTKEAVSTVQRIIQSTVDEFQKQDAVMFAKTLDDAWKTVREAALRYTCKTENSPSDKGTTTAWMNTPESPNDDFKRNVDESLNELNREIMRCETDIEMLWDAVETIRDKLPKEWGK